MADFSVDTLPSDHASPTGKVWALHRSWGDGPAHGGALGSDWRLVQVRQSHWSLLGFYSPRGCRNGTCSILAANARLWSPSPPSTSWPTN